METYARELIPALLEARPDLRLTFFVNDETFTDDATWGAYGDIIRVPVHARRRTEWVRGEQLLLPQLAHRAGVDVLHSLGSTSPAHGRFKRVTTIHDVIYRLHPEAHGGVRSRAMSALIPLSARRSHRIIAPSRRTRDDLVELLSVPDRKIDVVSMGVAPRTIEPTSESELRSRLRLGTRTVVLTASAKRPHKNLERLLAAWALLASERPILVLPGYPTDHESTLHDRAAALGLADDTRFVGWIARADLEGLYALAACFVFPSLYEGFGLPVLEAMARGIPVISSDRGALAEVAGDAACLVDPESPEAIAAAVESVLGNPSTAERLRAAGIDRSAKFPWSATARSTLETYERALASSE
jgi:glycosyltransferase involved in cell wall biosynthesis